MAIMMHEEVPGMTGNQFDAIFGPLVDQLMAYPGFITNVSGPIPGGYQVTELWESQEAHERWLREVIIPAMQSAGVNLPLPSTRYFTLDHLITR